jgi:hypothetical protein
MAIWNLGHFIGTLNKYNGSRLVAMVLTDDAEKSASEVFQEIDNKLDKSFRRNVRGYIAREKFCSGLPVIYHRERTELVVIIREAWCDSGSREDDFVSVYVPSWSLEFRI